MPNGGSDCCGTCWFNEANRGRAGSRHHDPSIPSRCEIRDVAIEDPFYTYCANHPYRRPDRDPIPIGPILRPGEPEADPAIRHAVMLDVRPRAPWMPSPDTEEVRRHLVSLLTRIWEESRKDGYIPAPSLAATVIWQLGEFREPRAIPGLKLLLHDFSGQPVAEDARRSLARIRGAA